MEYGTGWSSNERKAVDELKKRMENEVSPETLDATDGDNVFYYRFLKARNFDVNKAEIMLRKHLIWRKVYQINTFLEEFPVKDFYKNHVCPSIFGFDKVGDVAVYVAGGNYDAQDLLKCTKLNDYMNHCVWFSEKMMAIRRQLKRNGREHPQALIIIDLEKLTFKNAVSPKATEVGIRLLRTLSDHYPECLKITFFINAPSYFLIMFSLLKAVMSGELLQKINVYGKDGWKEKLSELVDPDVLPAFLGGNRTDPDGNPYCTTICKPGGKMPEIYYLSEGERFFEDRTQVKHITVPQSEKKEIYVDVEKSGSLMQWKYLVHKKNIGFGLYIEDPRQQCGMEEILPIQIYETVDGTDEGYYKTKSAGRYIFVFDNTYSWKTPKEVEYCIKVTTA